MTITKLPNYTQAIVAETKITAYLLSSTHRDGQHKAAFFTRFGFRIDAWQVLAAALLQHAADNDVTKIEPSPFGTTYAVDGRLHAPDGRAPLVRVVWFIEDGEDMPRLVTAYPL